MPTAAELINRGGELFTNGDRVGAKIHYLGALALDPDNPIALANMAAVLASEDKLVSAIAYQRRVMPVASLDGHQWNHLGNYLTRFNKYDEAEACMKRAAELSPESSEIWHNYMLLALRAGRYSEALQHAQRAKALGDIGPGLINNISLCLLYQGTDLATALEAYEARWESIAHSQAWDFHIPEWQGESLDGKSLLLHMEQGFGDTLMTVRFVRNLTALGAKVTIGAIPTLNRLFDEQGWSTLNLLKFDAETARQFDFHSPMFSALRWLKIEQRDVTGESYLIAPQIVTPSVPRNKFNVGICWASGIRGDESDWRRRIAPLEDWLQLSASPNVALHSLQVGEDSESIDKLGVSGLISDPTRGFSDWADTAAFIAKLDLVITIDTAVAHLAGALGKPVWMLSQFLHCWRWWNLSSGSGAPWYDSMTILQQTDPNDWNSMLAKCMKALRIASRSNIAFFPSQASESEAAE